MKRFVPVLALVATLALTACSSDDKSSESSSATTAPSGSATTAAPGAYSGDRNSRFCQIGADFTRRFQDLPGTLQGSAATLRTEIDALKGVVDQAKAAAPAQIKGDVETLANAFGKYFTRLQETNYDARAASGELAKLGTAEVQSAAEHLQTYGAQVCGITTTSTP